jgi:sugar lactone lactonase YvrE
VLAPAFASLIFTLAGTGTAGTVPDGTLAARANLQPNASVAPLADHTFLVGAGDVVQHADARGTLHVVARGTHVSGLAALPGGGFLIADGKAGRVQRVDASGRMTTVAGGGNSRADGVPATQAQLGELSSVAIAPGGGFVIGDGGLGIVRQVGPDGLIRTIAGDGQTESEIPRLTGQPATTVPLNVSDVAVEPDGSVLIADFYASRVVRVSPSGAITVAADRVSAYGVGALPDGGFLDADNGIASEGANARIWRYAPDGSRRLLAGTGRFVSSAPSGLEHRGDGGNALDADLGFLRDVKPAADGGVLFTEGTDSLFSEDTGALVRYLAPAQPGILAAAIVRDRDRVFTPGRPSHISVTTTLPATLRAGGRRIAVPAGTTRVPLPALSARPHAITVIATDAAGRRAVDRARVFPRGYLPDETARLVAAGIAFSVLGAEDIAGDGVLGCRRVDARRVDCEMAASGRRCQAVANISYAAHRLRWGTAGCFDTRRGYRRPRALRERDWSCEDIDSSCPPALFGKLTDDAVVPSS